MSLIKPKNDQLNPRTTTYEFMGPPGALLVTVGVPLMTYLLYFGCSESAGACPPSYVFSPSLLAARVQETITDRQWWASLWDTEAALIYLAWYAFCVVAWAILPGDWVEGLTMRNGQKKKYKINGTPHSVYYTNVSSTHCLCLTAFSTFLLTLGITTGYIIRYGPESFTFLYDKWLGFVTASLIMSIVQAVAVYAGSYREGALLATGGNSGNPIYDFFIGRELNPSIGSFDIKSFNELRPGLILWVLIDISMVCVQAARRGGWENVTWSMWLVLVFQSFYVADGLYNEPAIFTTMDITTDGFGFMLAAGDITWVPFVYSLQARYLVFRPVELNIASTVGILAVNALGYWIFRDANGEKNDFRNGKNPKNLTYMTTERGTKLLTSGWWGRSRHPNYFGDLLMAVAWSLPTGFETPITYFYVTYFAVLLIHRQRRDDENCEKKYGKDWEKYKQLVPYRIIPYVY
ncbi:ERG4/ERG24 ergosterol biosynthesis protein [Boletus reticuloceps]|uniref:Delta(14)-sterol reductase ERG24 n=1 Tax=Boletus reticuloceps TaxID=495285 RepID=A0A8I2YCK6_9AGAM|nr:ERG4/ERG24 ergosterol biosynthesis protein [Boletus reticuloceps]